MGMIPIALVVVASIVGVAAQVRAIELGELQAVPSNSLPYVFRLPLLTPPHSAPASAAVTVRQPPDTLAFVRQHVIELRLRTLADVELELSYGGQTLNRLLLKSELQAARMRMEMVPASNLSLAVKAKSRDRPSPEAMPMAQAVASASNRSLIEREIEGIRQEIHGLVERVVPWAGGSPAPEVRAGDAIPPVLTLVLGGVFIVAVTSLTIGCLPQRRAMERERRRRAALTASIRRMRAQLAGEVPILPALQSTPRSRATNEALVPVAIMRRIHVAQKTRRRLRVWASGHTRNHTEEHDAEPSRPQARASRRMPSAAAELLDALAQLRGELMRLQGRPTTPTTAEHAETLLRQASR
jgi:hypothetical protein